MRAIQDSATICSRLLSVVVFRVVFGLGLYVEEAHPWLLYKSSISPLPKTPAVWKANLASWPFEMPSQFPYPLIQTPSSLVSLGLFLLRTSIIGSPSCAQAAARSLLSIVPSLSLCLLAAPPLQLYPIHSSRGRARFGLVPTLSCPPSIQGPIGLHACDGIGGGRTILRWQGQ